MGIIFPLSWKILMNFAANAIHFTGEENITAWLLAQWNHNDISGSLTDLMQQVVPIARTKYAHFSTEFLPC